MKMLRPDILGSRALNASRKLHLPTYVATRYLLETVAGKTNSSWVNKVIPRKFLLQDQPSFFPTLKFKKTDNNGSPVYRDFVVPSPITLLTEVLLLDYMAQSKEFEKSSRVYSYIWPSDSECPYNFEHYISGYKKRNEDISKYLSMNSDKIVIISDIERFYPTIDQQIVRERFLQKLKLSDFPPTIKSIASKMLEDLYHYFPQGRGVATGPEISHVLGDIALKEFDEVLDRKYGDAYFRYVDDIILVVDPSEKDEVIEILDSLTKQEGLVINQEKNDFLTGEMWQRYGPHNESDVSYDSFEALLFRTKSYLKVNPDSEKNLAEALEKAGYLIPISRLSSASKTISFTTKLITLINIGWSAALDAASGNIESILRHADLVRGKVRQKLGEFVESDIPDGTTLRKWHLQRLRYFTNRAVYLLPHKELAYLVPKLEEIPEFVDTVALLKTLISGEDSSLLDLPGAALTASAGLLKQRGLKLKDIKVTKDSTSAQIESASIYALWDVADIVYTDITLENNEAVEYLKFASGVAGYKRHVDSHGYLDEIRSLALNAGKNDNLRILESRSYDSEGTVLDALGIGWNSEY